MNIAVVKTTNHQQIGREVAAGQLPIWDDNAVGLRSAAHVIHRVADYTSKWLPSNAFGGSICDRRTNCPRSSSIK
jgi:hypothetical protein